MDRPRKRRRPAKSCEPCRQRKMRCDMKSPCRNCERSRSKLTCIYRDSDTSHTVQHQDEITPAHTESNQTPKPQGCVDTRYNSSSRNQEDRESLSQLGSSVRDLQRRLQDLEDQVGGPGSAKRVAPNSTIADELQKVKDKICHLEQELSPENSQTTEEAEAGLSIAANPPLLRVAEKKMKFMGPMHYIHSMGQQQFASPFQANEQEPSYGKLKSELADLVRDGRSLRQSVKAQQSVQPKDPFPNLIHTIPPKAICDELVQCYLHTFEPIYRIIHLSTFWVEYRQFWEQGSLLEIPFLMKLLLIFTIGTVFHPQRSKAGQDHDVHLPQTWIQAAQCWLTSGPLTNSTGNLDGIQVFCLLLIARQISPGSTSSWLSTGALMDMALETGLHRKSLSVSSLSVWQVEMRARLWITALELVVHSSMDSAKPLLLPALIDSDSPSNLNDEDFDDNTDIAPSPRPHYECTDVSLQLLLHQSFAARRKVLHLLNDNKDLSYPAILELGGELRAACDKIETFFSSCNSTIDTHASLKPTDFHRKFIQMTLHRYIITLHTPFMTRSSQNPQYYFSRKVCLESALTIASYADTLNLPTDPTTLDDFSRLTIAGHGTLKGPLSFDVISIIGLELISQMEEEQPSTAQSRSSNTVLSELVTAKRAPLKRTLQHMLTQSLQIIALGTPSLKRFIVIAAMLAQIRTMESGQSVKRTVYEAVRESGRQGYEVLLPFNNAIPTPASNECMADTLSPGSMGFDPSAGLDFDLDIPTLLGMPELASADYLNF